VKKTSAPRNARNPSQVSDQQSETSLDLDEQIQENQKTPNKCVKRGKVHVHISCEHTMIFL